MLKTIFLAFAFTAFVIGGLSCSVAPKAIAQTSQLHCCTGGGAAPAPTQGTVAVCTNPPATPFADPQTACGNGVAVSGIEFGTYPTASTCGILGSFGNSNSHLEINNATVYTNFNNCANLTRTYTTNYVSATIYNGSSASGDFFQFRGAVNNNPEFYSPSDKAHLSCAPLSTSSILVTFLPSFFDSAGTGSYVLYNASTNSAIATIAGTGVADPVTTADPETSATSYYVNYVAVETTLTANVSTGQQTVTPTSTVNMSIDMYLLICNGNAGNPAGCGSDKEVVRVNYISAKNSSSASIAAVFAHSHTCSSGTPCLVYAEVPYSSIDPLDGFSNAGDSGTMPNVPYAGFNSYYPGTRLGTTANAYGFKAPTCTPAAPGSTPVLSGYEASPSPQIRAPTATGGGQSTPAPGPTPSASPGLTVFETATTQTTPDPYYCYGSNAGNCAWTLFSPACTWTKTSTSFASTTEWTTTSGCWLQADGDRGYAAAFEICQSGVTPPWPTDNCTPPFFGTQSEDERFSWLASSKSLNNFRWLAPCNPRSEVAIVNQGNASYATGADPLWPNHAPTLYYTSPVRAAPSSPPAWTRFDDYAPESVERATGSGIELNPTLDPFIPTDADDLKCVSQYGPISNLNLENASVDQAWGAMISYRFDLNQPSAVTTILNNSTNIEPATYADNFIIGGTGGTNCPSGGMCWYSEVDSPMKFAQAGYKVDLHAINNGNGCTPGPACVTAVMQERYNAFTMYLIIKDDPVVDGHWNISWKDAQTGCADIDVGGSCAGDASLGCAAGCMDPIFYVPIGSPLTAEPADIGPCGATWSSSCSYASSVGLWNATDGMYERCFTHGCAYYCPMIFGGTGQTDCNGNTVNLPTGNGCSSYYLLEPSTDYIDDTTAGMRQYAATAVTSFVGARNTGAIYMCSKS